jgi:hypothetical protein
MRIYLIGLFLASFILSAEARPQFPKYNSLTAEQQKACGYTANVFVEQNYATLSVLIPPKAAKYCHDARIYLRDKQKNLLSIIDAELIKGKDGSLSINVELRSAFADAELIIRTDEIPGTEYLGDFGGFSFELPTKP